MKIGFMEIVVVFVVALLLIGPDKLPEFAKKLGAGLRAFRNATNDLTSEIKENVVEPLEEAQAPIREAMEPLEEMDREIRGSVKEVQTSLNNIGKPTKKPAAKPEKRASTDQLPEAPAGETAPAPVEAAETEAAVPEATSQNQDEGGENP
ncbi:MAG: twin-arginine translocase TatA/TatE family subunit [Clostridiales bacterium]|nr:twin-arginine translocase TatA/TatE family subunit [Clostridiales bacterium]